jgi:hypothetical protein
MLSIGSAIDYCPIAPFSLLMVPVREGRRSTDRKLPTSSDCNSTELKWLVPLPALKAKSQVPERQGLPGVRAVISAQMPVALLACPRRRGGSWRPPYSSADRTTCLYQAKPQTICQGPTASGRPPKFSSLCITASQRFSHKTATQTAASSCMQCRIARAPDGKGS